MCFTSREHELADMIGYFQKLCLHLLCIKGSNGGIRDDAHFFACKPLFFQCTGKSLKVVFKINGVTEIPVAFHQ